MADVAKSSSCSCLPIGITNLLLCFGFDQPKNPTSLESSSRDESIINVFPPLDDQFKNPSSEESPISRRQNQIINVVAPAKDTNSAEAPNSDGTVIGIGLPQSSEGVITIGGGLYIEDAGVPPVYDEGNKPISKEIPTSEGLITGGVGFPEENNPIPEEFPSPSGSEQPPVIIDYGFPIGTQIGVPPEWTRSDPNKRSVNIGRPGGTH